MSNSNIGIRYAADGDIEAYDKRTGKQQGILQQWETL